MEGKHGWAKHLPTTKNILGQFTLYHVYMLLFLALLFSGWFGTRFVAGCASGWTVVFHFAFYFLLWLLVEDFCGSCSILITPLIVIEKQDLAQALDWRSRAGPQRGGDSSSRTVSGGCGQWGSLALVGDFGVMLVACVLVAPQYHKFYVQTHQPYCSLFVASLAPRLATRLAPSLTRAWR